MTDGEFQRFMNYQHFMIVPECFSGEECYEDWIDQFENIAEINHWNDGQKLI